MASFPGRLSFAQATSVFDTHMVAGINITDRSLRSAAVQQLLTHNAHARSVLHIASKCLEEDVSIFKYSIQDIVDELEVCCSRALLQTLCNLTILVSETPMFHKVMPAGNAENMLKTRRENSCFTLALHPYQMQPSCLVR